MTEQELNAREKTLERNWGLLITAAKNAEKRYITHMEVMKKRHKIVNRHFKALLISEILLLILFICFIIFM